MRSGRSGGFRSTCCELNISTALRLFNDLNSMHSHDRAPASRLLRELCCAGSGLQLRRRGFSLTLEYGRQLDRHEPVIDRFEKHIVHAA